MTRNSAAGWLLCHRMSHLPSVRRSLLASAGTVAMAALAGILALPASASTTPTTRTGPATASSLPASGVPDESTDPNLATPPTSSGSGQAPGSSGSGSSSGSSGSPPSSGTPAAPTTTTAPPVPSEIAGFYQVPDPLSPAPPGAIIRTQELPASDGIPARSSGYRVLYHSESIDGSDIAVSGVVLVPGKPPPRGGYRIVSWAHGTTGLAASCAPSMWNLDDIPYLDQFLAAGYVVTATDYQGLGTSGVDPYLVGQSEGQSILDAARAARDLLGTRASDDVLVFGHSQGGQAALFAGQIAPTYAPELFIAGVVAVAPVADVTEFVPPTVGKAANPLSVYTVASLYSWEKTYGGLTLSSLLTPKALAITTTIEDQCINTLAAEFASLPTDRIFRPGWENEASVLALETENEPGLAPTIAPILVVQGVEDTLTPYAEASTMVKERLCRDQHDTVDFDAVHNAGHSNVLIAAQTDALHWISARLSGKGTSRNTCPRATTSTSG
jgi:pimeloyl-ACP methyl ester carboxylesterase